MHMRKTGVFSARRALALMLSLAMVFSMSAAPAGAAGSAGGDTRFMLLDGEETVNHMMARINAATPAYREGYLTNGKPITDANIQELLSEIKRTMPTGAVWDSNAKYNYSSTRWGAAYGAASAGGGCNSFAACVSDAIFGEDAPILKNQDFDHLKVGDVQWKRTAPSLTNGHVRLFMTQPDNEGYAYYCDGGETVSWDLVYQTKIGNADALRYSENYSRYSVQSLYRFEPSSFSPIVADKGTEQSALGLPDKGDLTFTYWNEISTRQFTDVPITWAFKSSGQNTAYDSDMVGAQTFVGTFDLSGVKDTARGLAGDDGTISVSTAPTAELTVVLVDPEIQITVDPFERTYDGTGAALPVGTLPAGIASAAVSYSGTSSKGEAYAVSATPPVNAGSYEATVSFTMAPGQQVQLEPVTVSYTIKQATPAMDDIYDQDHDKWVGDATYNSIVFKPIEGMEYKVVGLTDWSTATAVTSGIEPNTQYTVQMRKTASNDGNYSASAAVSATVTTKSLGPVTVGDISSVTLTYGDEAQPIIIDPLPVGVTGYSVTYKGTSLGGTAYNSNTPPSDAGRYTATVSFNADSGYEKPGSIVVSYTINPKKMDVDDSILTIRSITSNSVTFDPVPGAQYSIDAGRTWKDDPAFLGLIEGRQYTVLARMKPTSVNYLESDTVQRIITPASVVEGVPVSTGILGLANKSYDGEPIQVSDISIDGLTISMRVLDPQAKAGRYTVEAALSGGYTWSTASEATFNEDRTVAYVDVWIFPQIDPVYVGGTLADVKLTTGGYWSIPEDGVVYSFRTSSRNTITSFSAVGTSTVLIEASVNVGGDITDKDFERPIEVIPWEVTKVSTPPPVEAALGTRFASLELPGTVNITARGGANGKVMAVSTTWDGSAYDPNSVEPQLIPGVFNFSGIRELNGAEQPEVYITVTLVDRSVEVAPPEVEDFEKTYDGSSTAIQLPNLPTGITVADISYSGFQRAPGGGEGAAYGPSGAPPVNAGTYTATVTFAAAENYKLPGDAEPVTVAYTILPGEAEDSVRALTGNDLEVTQTSIEIGKNMAGVEVSIDGNSWRPLIDVTFTGLRADTEYTIYMRTKGALQDNGNTIMVPKAIKVRTLRQQAGPFELLSMTTPYTGQPISYSAYTTDGVRVDRLPGVTAIEIRYTVSDAQTTDAPTAPGSYSVTVSFAMAEGYDPIADHSATLIISKAAQGRPAAEIEETTYDSIVVAEVAGAEYSIDKGAHWQDSRSFTGLNAGTNYTILVRMKATAEHEASAATTLSAKTLSHSITLPAVADDPPYTYDGAPHPHSALVALESAVGVERVEVLYTGTSNAGAAYSSSLAPTEAGTYTVSFAVIPETGYEQPAAALTAGLRIEKAHRSLTEAPVISKTTSKTLVVNPIQDAEYSIDNGAHWQSSNTFTGLNADRSYRIEVRLAETANYYVSSSDFVNGRTLPGGEFGYEINYRAETITFDSNVMQVASDAAYRSLLAPGAAITPNSTLFCRLLDDGTGGYGATVEISIPARPTAPAITLNGAEYTVNTTSAMEYSTDNGATWIQCPGGLNVETLAGKTIKVRLAATSSYFAGVASDFPVPGRGTAPSLMIDMNRETIDTTAAMEYTVQGGSTWTPCSNNMPLAAYTGKTIFVRIAATATAPAGASIAVAVPGRGHEPVATVQLGSELVEIENLNVIQAYEAQVSGVWIRMTDALSVSNMCGGMVVLRTPASADKFASPEVEVEIPARNAAPAVIVDLEARKVTCAVDAGSLQFSRDALNWAAVDEGFDARAHAGETLFSRLGTANGKFAGPMQKVTMPGEAAVPVVVLDCASETISTETGMEYSINGGIQWYAASGPLNVSAMTGDTVFVRTRSDSSHFSSDAVSVMVPERRRGPEINVNIGTEVIEVFDATVEARIVFRDRSGYGEWKQLTGSIPMGDYLGYIIQFRHVATDSEFVSSVTTIALPDRADGPVLYFDVGTMTVDTTEAMEYSTDSGVSWLPCSKDMNCAEYTDQTLVFRYAGTASALASSATSVVIKAWRAAPAVVVDIGCEQLSCEERLLEYSGDGGKTWVAFFPPMRIGELAGKEILLRVPADTEQVAGKSIIVRIPTRPAAPRASLDLQREIITLAEGMEISIDNGANWIEAETTLNAAGLEGKDLIIRVSATSTSFASDPVVVSVPARREAPALSTTNTTGPGKRDGSIKGVSAAMEWRPAGDPDWSVVSGTAITGLKAGSYEVRYTATSTQLASAPCVVTISNGSAPSAPIEQDPIPSYPIYPGFGGITSSATINFQSNGGTPVPSQWIIYGNRVAEPAAPSKDGYEFSGWFKDPSCSIPYDFTCRVYSSFVLYAKWDQKPVPAVPSEQPGTVPPTSGPPAQPPAQQPPGPASVLNNDPTVPYITGRTGDLADPQANVTRGEVAMIIYRLMTEQVRGECYSRPNIFADVPVDAWYSDAVVAMQYMGVMTGRGADTFAPGEDLTRAEMATIAVRLLGIDSVSGAAVFTDTIDHWAAASINAAAARGIVKGTGNGLFQPDRKITRAEAIAVMNRLLGRAASAETAPANYKRFKDVPVDAWYYWDIIVAANGATRF